MAYSLIFIMKIYLIVASIIITCVLLFSFSTMNKQSKIISSYRELQKVSDEVIVLQEDVIKKQQILLEMQSLNIEKASD